MKIEFKNETFKNNIGTIPVGTVFTVKSDLKKYCYLKTVNLPLYKELGGGDTEEELVCNCLCLPSLTPMLMPLETEIKPLYFPNKIIFE